jgi:hypothetical protein
VAERRWGLELTPDEGFEKKRRGNCGVVWVTVSFALQDTKCKFAAGGKEQNQRDDLKDKTSHHDILAKIARLFGVCARGNSTSKALQNQADNVAGNED